MKNKARMSAKERILRMVMIALFCALAFAVMPLFRINVMFLTFDIKDAVITVPAYFYSREREALLLHNFFDQLLIAFDDN